MEMSATGWKRASWTGIQWRRVVEVCGLLHFRCVIDDDGHSFSDPNWSRQASHCLWVFLRSLWALRMDEIAIARLWVSTLFCSILTTDRRGEVMPGRCCVVPDSGHGVCHAGIAASGVFILLFAIILRLWFCLKTKTQSAASKQVSPTRRLNHLSLRDGQPKAIVTRLFCSILMSACSGDGKASCQDFFALDVKLSLVS